LNRLFENGRRQKQHSFEKTWLAFCRLLMFTWICKKMNTHTRSAPLPRELESMKNCFVMAHGSHATFKPTTRRVKSCCLQKKKWTLARPLTTFRIIFKRRSFNSRHSHTYWTKPSFDAGSSLRPTYGPQNPPYACSARWHRAGGSI